MSQHGKNNYGEVGPAVAAISRITIISVHESANIHVSILLTSLYYTELHALLGLVWQYHF